MTQLELSLPGMEPARDSDSPMVKAAHASIAALRAGDRLTAVDALRTQLILSLAEAIDRGSRTGRASAVAMASKELRETLDRLDPPPEAEMGGDQAQQLSSLMTALELAANNGGHLPDGWRP